ncbi:MAG: hypothetical protein IIA23_11370 [Chloroflexi bacterium]|nr:hypothetical protein [Chloroflexota bacterium]
MAIDQDILEKLRSEADIPALDLSWLDLDNVWGVRAKPGKRGLTLDEIEVGPYGEAPETSTNRTLRPRGAVARP